MRDIHEYMGIKNFFVRSESIKEGYIGLARYLNYLEDIYCSSHKGRTRILPITNNKESFYKKCCLELLNSAEKNIKVKKGGRPPSVTAQSFCISLPYCIKPSRKEWALIAKRILQRISSSIGVDYMDLKENCYINIHEQDNNHLNIVISRRINGESVAAKISRPSTTNAVKLEINRCVYGLFSIKNTNYIPALESKRLKRWHEVSKVETENKAIKKEILRLHKQIINFIEATLEDNSRLFYKRRNRILKTLEIIKEKSDDKCMLELINETNRVVNDVQSNSKKNRRGSKNKIRPMPNF